MQYFLAILISLCFINCSSQVTAQDVIAYVSIDSTDIPIPNSGGVVDFFVDMVNTASSDKTIKRNFIVKYPNGTRKLSGIGVTQVIPAEDTASVNVPISFSPEDPPGVYQFIWKYKFGGTLYTSSINFTKNGNTVEEITYHDGVFETQQGCGGVRVCYLGVRFTPSDYPASLEGIDITQTIGATSKFDVLVYTDTDGLATGPVGDSTIVAENIGGSSGLYSIAVTDTITIESGDFYIAILEVAGYVALGLDTTNQDVYVDRQWVRIAFPGQSWQTLKTAVDSIPDLYGNFGISVVIDIK